MSTQWFGRRLALGLAVLLVSTSACSGPQAVEEMPPGSEVSIELDTGEVVTGRLVDVQPDALVVEPEATGQPQTIDRGAILEVAQPGADDDRSFVDRLFSREPAFDDIEIPAGTVIETELETTLTSDTSRVEDPVRATIVSPVVVEGREVVPPDAAIIGSVTRAEPSGKVKGRAQLAFAFDRLTTGTMIYEIGTAPFSYIAEPTKAEDAAKIGVGAAAGTVVGALTGGRKGAAVGAAVGGGAGTAVVLATAGDEVELRSGRQLRVELTRPLTVRLPRRTS